LCANAHGTEGRARAVGLLAAAAGGTTSMAPTGPPPAATTATAVGVGAAAAAGHAAGAKAGGASTSDGLVEVEHEASRLRFAEDDRVHEVRALLKPYGLRPPARSHVVLPGLNSPLLPPHALSPHPHAHMIGVPHAAVVRPHLPPPRQGTCVHPQTTAARRENDGFENCPSTHRLRT
jgi:hypothetical protein